MSARTFFEGCGIGIALTLSYTWEQLAPDHIGGLYLRALPVSTVAGGAALDLAAVSLVSWGLFIVLGHFDREKKTLIWTLLTAIVPAILLRTIFSLGEAYVHVPSTLALSLALLIPSVFVWRFFPAAYRKLAAAVQWGYLSLGVCILWVLPQLVLLAIHHQPHEAMASSREASAAGLRAQASAGESRIIWILLDELSYDQAFEHRQPGLKLPNFDALRAESTSFSDVQPAGYYTDYIVPALLRGRPVTSIDSSLDGALSVRESRNARWERFDPQSTVFADAERMGWSTGIVGWFNPYCRLFAAVVDSCLWVPESRLFPGHMNSANTAWQNALTPLGTKFHQNAGDSLTAEHRAAYPVLLNRALDLVNDAGIRFVFLHFPVPHPPGIYNRAAEQMRNGGSYLDNLALADETLRVLRSAIDRSPMAHHTILIVSSDHSMRVLKWRGGAYWTAEDEAVFHGRFDPRPVLMVHFPDEQAESAVRSPFAEIRIHDLIEELLKGKMDGADGLDAWLRTNDSR